MTNHEYNLIICTLALDSEDTVEQILQEMQATIYHLFTQLPRTPEMQALVDSVKREGEIPTVREFLEYCVEAQKRGVVTALGLLN